MDPFLLPLQQILLKWQKKSRRVRHVLYDAKRIDLPPLEQASATVPATADSTTSAEEEAADGGGGTGRRGRFRSVDGSVRLLDPIETSA
jgi:hypothetical protein